MEHGSTYPAPFKMFVENHSVTYYMQGEVKQKVVDMDKNSYVVLTRSCKGKPALQQMYDKMRKNIHVINTISARRAKRNVKQIDQPCRLGYLMVLLL